MQYTIMFINDRCADNISKTKTVLKDFEFVDQFEFINGNTDPDRAMKEIERRNINICWEHSFRQPRSTEFAVWANALNIFEYVADNNIEKFLVLEDDAVLIQDFLKAFNAAMTELPKDFDFFALYAYREGREKQDNEFTSETDIGATYIHKALNLPWGTQAMLYSNSGVSKILENVYHNGIYTTNDDQIFRAQHHSQEEYKLAGYAMKNEYQIIEHDDSVGSIIGDQWWREQK